MPLRVQATLAFENQEDGFVAKILVAEGTKDVPVGAPLAIVVEEAGSLGAFAGYSAGADAAPTPAAPAPAAAPEPSTSNGSGSYPPHIVSGCRGHGGPPVAWAAWVSCGAHRRGGRVALHGSPG
jgi:pyruvate/2-oxoglutarate dehydrogenase complex dihydrolipoamide acyltransferase (E2) component